MIFCVFTWTSLLTSCLSLQNGQKIIVRDAHGMTGIGRNWIHLQKSCLSTGWAITSSSMSICSFTNESCTIVSPQYIVNEANELFIDVTTETRPCATVSWKTCDNTFVLFVAYELFKRRRVEVIGNIPQFIPSHINNTFFKRREIINFSKDQAYDYIMVGLNESNYCGFVSLFSIYYYNCPPISPTNELIEFVQQAAPNISSSPTEVLGKCVKHAVQTSYLQLAMKCFFNGSFEIRGRCECRPGFANVNRKCEACAPGTFKDVVGNKLCLPCGNNSISQQTSCFCKPDHERAKNQVADSSSDCYKLPNRVSNIKFSGVTSSSVNISWSDSVTKKEDYNYIIDCIGCYKRNIFPVESDQTYVILKSLDPSSLYYITVAINNSATVLTGKWPSESGTFRTQNKGESWRKGAINGGVIGGAVAGIVLVLIILGFAVWFLKLKRTDSGNKAVKSRGGNEKTEQQTGQPIYAEAADPNYIPLVHESGTRQTYEELKVTQTNLHANECSHNADSGVIGFPNQRYTNLAEMNPYVNTP